MEIRKPNLFVVGAARCGTSSLWNCLRGHPEIYMPEEELLKEPTYFSEFGKNWKLENYLDIFKQAAGNPKYKYFGEASVAYLTDPKSAGNIYSFNPEAKILIILRNPAERAYSLYNWMVQDGYEYISDFHEALQTEKIRSKKKEPDWYRPNYYCGYLYYESGKYFTQVKRYSKLFKDRLLIIKFEDYVQNNKDSLKNIYSFLGVDPVELTSAAYNSSSDVYSAKIQFILRKLNKNIIRKIRQDISLTQITAELKSDYKNIALRLSEVAPLNIIEKSIGKILLLRIKNYLRRRPDQYSHRLLNSKQERDRMLEYGKRKSRPKKLDKLTKKKLLDGYESDIIKLSESTRIDFTDWLAGP